MSSIQMSELDNGLRVVTDQVTAVSSVALGAWVGVGTRNENIIHNGAAHMVEHMMFKGTERRNSLDIAQEIENVGGSMNAYTSREITSYHMHVLQDDVPLALDVLADMMQNPTMPEEEIERERHVILQEIGMCHDTPDDFVFDNYYEVAYPGQSLGAPILGKPDIIKSIDRTTLLEYVCRFYTPSRMVISAAGNVDHDKFVQQVEELFQNMPNDIRQGRFAPEYKGGESRNEKDLEQAHIVLGFQGLSRLDDDFYAVQALSNILGGGMSSRLFQEIREKRGLVYSIYSFHNAYIDDGQFGVYAGTGPDDLPELVPALCHELLKTINDLSDEEVACTITQMKAGLLMGRESMMARADSQAKYAIFREDVLDVQKLVAKIEALSVDQIQSVAKRVFSTKPTLAALGPLDHLETYDGIANRLHDRKHAA